MSICIMLLSISNIMVNIIILKLHKRIYELEYKQYMESDKE